jgi:hypothetical protein
VVTVIGTVVVPSLTVIVPEVALVDGTARCIVRLFPTILATMPLRVFV